MDLTKYRDQINEVDDQILALLQKRAEISKKVGAVKAEAGDAQVYVPHRQKQVVERLKEQNAGKFPEAALEAIWAEILSASRSLQEPERVAFLGPVGSFGHLAARHHFGASTGFIPVHPQVDIFTEVEAGRADYGVVAIENSLQGTVRDVLERLQHTPLWICAETFQPIEHHLLSKSPLTEIRRVYSHPQPFAQCRAWISRYLSHADQIEVVSTSEAAQLASQEPAAAAIASELASEIYQVPIVANAIMDEPDNTTRFFIIGSQMADRSGYDRTSLFFAVRDKIGALYQALGILQEAELNLTYIESLPSRTQSWEYIFFAEMEGHIVDKRVILALEKLEALCQNVNVIGSYPRGDSLMSTLTQQIQAYAHKLGFELIGITPAARSETIARYRQWVKNGYAGEMGYLERHLPLKTDVRHLLAEAKSVISLAMNYYTLDPPKALAEDPARGQISRYAWGDDYHDVICQRLAELVDFIKQTAETELKTRVCVDTAPIIEREYAKKQGSVGSVRIPILSIGDPGLGISLQRYSSILPWNQTLLRSGAVVGLAHAASKRVRRTQLLNRICWILDSVSPI